MRRTIVIFAVLFFAGPVYSADPYLVDYICISNPAHPGEAEFCELYRDQLIASESVVFAVDLEAAHFKFIILPTMRDEYTAVTVASNFMYPPLAGLALSAYLSSYILTPVQGEDLVRCIRYMIGKNFDAIAEWQEYFEGKIRPKPRLERPILEVSND